jgi:nicotinamide phosphoribosyltransferase
MLAPGITKLYGTWIPRSIKYAPKGIIKVVSFGQQLVWKFIHDVFEEHFFFRNEKFKNQLLANNEPLATEYNNKKLKSKALQFAKDMCLYLGMEYDGKHFEELWDLGYLPIKVKALPEGIETEPNIPHMTFINTVDGFAWLTLYLETIVSNNAWKPAFAATVAKLYRKTVTEWVMKTDPSNLWLVDYMCHDFSARGLSGMWDMVFVGLGHATSFRGSDTLAVIPAARYFYGEPDNEVCINSVNASEHSVTCTGIFYYKDLLESGKLDNEIVKYYDFNIPSGGDIMNPDVLEIAEYLNLRDWLQKFPKGILSVVSDTFDLWKLITHILPRLKKEILARDGKLVIRPDSGDPVDITCGTAHVIKSGDQVDLEYNFCELMQKLYKEGKYTKEWSTEIVFDGEKYHEVEMSINSDGDIEVDTWCDYTALSEEKGVIELLWDIFCGTINAQGYKVLDSHIGSIYGDSITPERQLAIYSRLADKGFASTNIVLGVGSFTYEYTTRDWASMAAKGSWFEVEKQHLENCKCGEGYQDPTCVSTHNGNSCSKVDIKKLYNIYKDPITDDGQKRSLKGMLAVMDDGLGNYYVKQECTPEEESQGLLQVIYEDGKFYNLSTFTQIRQRLNG